MRSALSVTLILVLFACATGEEAAGPYTMEVVGQSIRAHGSDFERCEMGKTPGTKGIINVAFDIQADGKVGKVAVDKTTLNQPRVESCVLDTLRMVQFPAPHQGDTVGVVYPFHFDK
jgi:hypothetical protein